MKLITSLNQFNIDFVLFCDPIKNNIISESNFIKIIYSSKLFSINGIYLFFYNNNNLYNNKNSFNITHNNDIIKQIQFIEKSILNKINIINKTQQYKIYEKIKTNNNKLFINNSYSIFNYDKFNNISQDNTTNINKFKNENYIQDKDDNYKNNKNENYIQDKDDKYKNNKNENYIQDKDDKYKNNKNENYQDKDDKLVIEYIYILKITGLWETKTKYGLNYKFILCNKYNLINQ